jgi:hypothetical protein
MLDLESHVTVFTFFNCTKDAFPTYGHEIRDSTCKAPIQFLVLINRLKRLQSTLATI